MKKKGKLDPYAYIPLKKAQLNRRYRPSVNLTRDSIDLRMCELMLLDFCSKGKEPNCRATSRAW